MDSSVKLFLIGIAVGILTLFLVNLGESEELWNIPGNYFEKFLAVSANVWLFIYMIVIVITIPVIALEPLKKRFSPKRYLPFPFMAGNGVAFLSVQIIAIILKVTG